MMILLAQIVTGGIIGALIALGILLPVCWIDVRLYCFLAYR